MSTPLIRRNPILYQVLSTLGLMAMAIVLNSAHAQVFGTGVLTPIGGWYPLGATLTVQALPGTNSVFSGWLGNTNGALMADSRITFTVSRSLSITGLFSSMQFQSNPPVPVRNLSVSGKGLTLSMSNLVPYEGWVLLQSSNLLLPLSQWQTNGTGSCDSHGVALTNLWFKATDRSGFFILK